MIHKEISDVTILESALRALFETLIDFTLNDINPHERGGMLVSIDYDYTAARQSLLMTTLTNSGFRLVI